MSPVQQLPHGDQIVPLLPVKQRIVQHAVEEESGCRGIVGIKGDRGVHADHGRPGFRGC